MVKLKSLPKQHPTVLNSTYSDLKELSVERRKRTLLHLNKAPMIINGDSNWMNIVNEAIVTYTYNKHSAYNRTPNDASNNPEKIKY